MLKLSITGMAVTVALAGAVMFAAEPAKAQLHNPCPYTNDGDCDEPNGLGLCDWGTDVADCSNPNSNFGMGSGYAGGGTTGGGTGLMNPCPYTNDGDCDEPNGLGYCDWGTDVADCSNPNSNFGAGSGFAGGGGTTGGGTGLMNPCPYTNDGDCDEPNGLGLCDWGTDVADCSNPNSNFGMGSGFAGGGGTTGGGGGTAGGGSTMGGQLLESYTAFLGWGDHYNSNGQRLTEPWQIIRQDRANYHRYGTGDPQDQWDSFFGDFNNRARAEEMLRNGYISPQARSAIVNGPVMIRVEIWGQGNTGTSIRVDVF